MSATATGGVTPAHPLISPSLSFFLCCCPPPPPFSSCNHLTGSSAAGHTAANTHIRLLCSPAEQQCVAQLCGTQTICTQAGTRTRAAWPAFFRTKPQRGADDTSLGAELNTRLRAACCENNFGSLRTNRAQNGEKLVTPTSAGSRQRCRTQQQKARHWLVVVRRGRSQPRGGN